MSSQRSASAPVGPQRQVGAVPPLGDQQAEVERRAGDPLRRRPRARTSRADPSGRGQFDAELLGRGGQAVLGEGEVPGADADVRDVPQPRRTPTADGASASVTSRPCAQVSMSRAVAIDAALIGGPNQGSRAPSGSAASASASAVAPGPPAGQQLLRRVGRAGVRGVVDDGGQAGTGLGRPRGRSRRDRWRRAAPARRSRPGGRSGGRSSSPRPGSGRATPSPRARRRRRRARRPRPAGRRAAVPAPPRRPPARAGDAAGSSALNLRKRGRDLARGLRGRASSAAVLLDAALLSTGIDDIPATARDLEARGYAGVWASEVDHDPFLPLLSAGQATETGCRWGRRSPSRSPARR